jgi:hypothetical protein
VDRYFLDIVKELWPWLEWHLIKPETRFLINSFRASMCDHEQIVGAFKYIIWRIDGYLLSRYHKGVMAVD